MNGFKARQRLWFEFRAIKEELQVEVGAVLTHKFRFKCQPTYYTRFKKVHAFVKLPFVVFDFGVTIAVAVTIAVVKRR